MKNVLKTAACAAALAGGLLPVTGAVAGVWFFSRSGKDSYFAAGVHGYNEPAAERPVRSAGDQLVRNRYEVERRPVWHETSRLDYAPGAVIRRGDHVLLTPDRYHFESDGYGD